MPVIDLTVIDIVSIDLNGDAVLTISDHLEWDDANEHLLILQDKINLYLTGIENGSLYEAYPNATGRHVIIMVAAKHEPNAIGFAFLERVSTELDSAGYGFLFQHLKPG